MSSAISSAQFKIEKPAKPRPNPAWLRLFPVFSSPMISIVSTPASPDITVRAHTGRRTAELLAPYASTATKKRSRDRSCPLLWGYCLSACAPKRACNRTILHGNPGSESPAVNPGILISCLPGSIGSNRDDRRVPRIPSPAGNRLLYPLAPFSGPSARPRR